MKIYMLAIGALFFILSETIMAMWLVKYLEEKLQLSISGASLLITSYWLSKALGLLVNQLTVIKVGLKRYLLISVGIGMIAITMLTQATSLAGTLFSILLFGFVNSGIYPSLISCSNMNIEPPSPVYISFIIFCGTIGAFVAAWSSGLLIKYIGLTGVMQFAALTYLFCVITTCLGVVNYKTFNIKNLIMAK